MESLTETKWDAVISGTGLQNSLLALALSRSNKKIIHVDQNEYYGDAEAAFSLQEVEEWVERAKGDSHTKPFRNASLWKLHDNLEESTKLSFSRAYTLSLSPQIIYTKSKLLNQLVSSKIYRQLEFQAVGNWWMYDGEGKGSLRSLPNGREDIFQDKSIDNRSKRRLMKFLKFVIDYENQTEVWELYAERGLTDFLSMKFQLPPSLQSVIAALTLSLDSPDFTPVKWALPRILRHLTSIGVFGPGFGAVIPKWGGGAEISQVACRAGAVGGGVYILGTGVQSSEPLNDEKISRINVTLSNGDVVNARHLVGSNGTEDQTSDSKLVSKAICIVSSPLTTLFTSAVEGSPLAAVSVIVFPPNTLSVEGAAQTNPVYIMAHSSETGECPTGQCVLYATTLASGTSKALLDAAVATFLKSAENGETNLLYNLYYEQESRSSNTSIMSDDPSLDLTFNDKILENVERQWSTIMTGNDEESQAVFMKFEDREGMNDEDYVED